MPEHLPLPVSDLAGKRKPPGTNLTEIQRELYDAVLKHSDDEDCMLPGVSSDAEGRLTEAEKF